MNKIIDIAPLIIFVALILVLLTFLSEKEDQLESVLIDSTFPEFSIASLKDPKRNLSKKRYFRIASSHQCLGYMVHCMQNRASFLDGFEEKFSFKNLWTQL